MKKIIFLFIVILSVYIIYYFNHDDKINYLSLGDALSVGIDANDNMKYGYSNYIAKYLNSNFKLKNYSNSFSYIGATTNSYINDIKINKKIKEKNNLISLKKCLTEANIITISLGQEELITKITTNKKYITLQSNEEIIMITNLHLKNLNNFFKEITKNTKNNIKILEYYNPLPTNFYLYKLYNYMNLKIKKLTKKYDIKFVDLYNLFKNNPSYLKNIINYYPTQIGNQAIGKEIIEKHLPN